MRQLLDGLRLTGWFLERHVFAPHDRKTPDARERLITHLRGLDVDRRDIV